MLPDALLTIMGWALAALGAAALSWFIFGDRLTLRGVKARRCPKCWYDLSHSPGLRCSECGYEAKRERQLHRARRKRRWVAAAMLIFIAAHLSLKGPAIKARGWFAAVPTTAFLFFFERLEMPPRPAKQPLLSGIPLVGNLFRVPPVPGWKKDGGRELMDVRFEQPMWSWQRWLFKYRASKMVEPLGTPIAAPTGSRTRFNIEPSTVPEHIISPDTAAAGEPTTPSRHAVRVWDRIIEDLLITPAQGRLGRAIPVTLDQSLWFKSDRWRCLVVWVEGEAGPCIVQWALRGRFERSLASYGLALTPADGVLRLHVQLIEPAPPRRGEERAGRVVLWEKRIERRIELVE